MNQPLPRSTPEAQGIASSAVLGFLDGVEKQRLELHSLMFLRHGQVVAQGWWFPYAATKPHVLYSLSKSFASTAAGMAVEEGFFSLDDRVLDFFPEDAPSEVSSNLAAMRVRHLLSMSTGHAQDTTRALREQEDDNWMKAFLAQPVEHQPGTHFLYNSGATYAVSAVVQKATGQTLVDFLEPRLWKPLGITEVFWESSPSGVNVGGWGLNLKTEDIARFGQLYLNRGVWNGERLLSDHWVEEATSAQIANGDDPNSDWAQGYGFQLWRCRHNAYRGDGAFGQFCVVMPDQDAVVAITSNVGDMGAVLNLIWEHLLPACTASALPENDATLARLNERLGALGIASPQGQADSPLAAQVSGKAFLFGDNEQKMQSLAFEFTGDECRMTIEDQWGTHEVKCGLGSWKTGETTFLHRSMWPRLAPRESWRVSAQGAWTSPDTFAAKLCFDETPFSPVLSCRFEGDEVKVELQGGIGFGPSQRPALVGRV